MELKEWLNNLPVSNNLIIEDSFNRTSYIEDIILIEASLDNNYTPIITTKKIRELIPYTPSIYLLNNKTKVVDLFMSTTLDKDYYRLLDLTILNVLIKIAYSDIEQGITTRNMSYVSIIDKIIDVMQSKYKYYISFNYNIHSIYHISLQSYFNNVIRLVSRILINTCSLSYMSIIPDSIDTITNWSNMYIDLEHYYYVKDVYVADINRLTIDLLLICFRRSLYG